MISRNNQVRSSAVWAAYGDALGFITELADIGRVRHRSGQSRVEKTVKWARKVGGRTGSFADFPAGTYSDDTQLRLATSRAIRRDGSFDVAAFAKVELPAWMSYSLGAGVGSREAASNLARSSAAWYSNFFENKKSSYFRGGGNGAAMRIQPHVWSAKNLGATNQILRDVVRNSIVTHGHPRGIVGACFHALTLASTMSEGRIPNYDTLNEILNNLRHIPEVVESDRDLRTFWLGRWLDYFPEGLSDAFGRVVDEVRADLSVLSKLGETATRQKYHQGVEAIGGFDPASRGSGTKTALLAWFLTDIFREERPSRIMIEAANTLGSDTDTIATMAGALIGVTTSEDCQDALQDRPYIEAEADRLSSIAMGAGGGSFDYPDLRSWKPMRVAADAIYNTKGELFLGGIGRVQPIEREAVQDGSDFILSWFELPFGQTILARTRMEPIVVEAEPTISKRPVTVNDADAAKTVARLPDLFASNAARDVKPNKTQEKVDGTTLHSQLQSVIASGFDKTLIGELILAQVDKERDDFVERSIALTSNIVTAYATRMRRKRD